VTATELLRLVVVDGSVTPDPGRRAPGRGAHLHPDVGCLDLALRRRAFPRAFRLPGPLDTTALGTYLERPDPPAGSPAGTRTTVSVPKAGRPT
jgi:predicted RNA-binding protein YlxR (DUF448 family)